MNCDGFESNDTSFNGSSMTDADGLSTTGPYDPGEPLPLVLESPASFHTFLTQSCHKSTPLTVKRLLDRSSMDIGNRSEDASWSSSLATPSQIEGLETAYSHECCQGPENAAQHTVPYQGKDHLTTSTNDTFEGMCQNSAVMPLTPSNGASLIRGGQSDSTEDVLSSFMCTPPSHRERKRTAPRKLHNTTDPYYLRRGDGDTRGESLVAAAEDSITLTKWAESAARSPKVCEQLREATEDMDADTAVAAAGSKVISSDDTLHMTAAAQPPCAALSAGTAANSGCAPADELHCCQPSHENIPVLTSDVPLTKTTASQVNRRKFIYPRQLCQVTSASLTPGKGKGIVKRTAPYSSTERSCHPPTGSTKPCGNVGQMSNSALPRQHQQAPSDGSTGQLLSAGCNLPLEFAVDACPPTGIAAAALSDSEDHFFLSQPIANAATGAVVSCVNLPACRNECAVDSDPDAILIDHISAGPYWQGARTASLHLQMGIVQRSDAERGCSLFNTCFQPPISSDEKSSVCSVKPATFQVLELDGEHAAATEYLTEEARAMQLYKAGEFSVDSQVKFFYSKDVLKKAGMTYLRESSNPCPFVTASGKSVAVSNDSLEKARLLLKEADDYGAVNAYRNKVMLPFQSRQRLFTNCDSAAAEQASISRGLIQVVPADIADIRSTVPGFDNETPSSDSRNARSEHLCDDFSLVHCANENSHPSVSNHSLLGYNKRDATSLKRPSSVDNAFAEHLVIQHDSLSTTDGKSDDDRKTHEHYGQPFLIKSKPCGSVIASEKCATVSRDAPQNEHALLADSYSANKTDSIDVLEEIASFDLQAASGYNPAISSEAVNNVQALFVNDDDRHVPCTLNYVSRKCQSDIKEAALCEKDKELNGSAATTIRSSIADHAGAAGIMSNTMTDIALTLADDSHCSKHGAAEVFEMAECGKGFQLRAVRARAFDMESWKPVPVSNEAPQEAQVVPGDCCLEPHGKTGKNYMQGKTSLPCSFSTASGKHVTVSRDSLAKVKAAFTDTGMQHMKTIAASNTSSPDCRARVLCPGFETASGKHVAVSRDTLAKVKAAFADAETQHIKTKTASNTSSPDCHARVPCPGFETASGKHVAVSRDSLAKVKAAFADETQQMIAASNARSPDYDAMVLRHGIKTASDNHVDVLRGSVTEVKVALPDANDETYYLETVAADDIGSAGLPIGVICRDSVSGHDQDASAPGSNVTALSESVASLGAAFAENDPAKVGVAGFLGNNSYQGSVVPSGFKTASGKQVVISCDSLLKAKAALVDTDNKMVHSNDASVDSQSYTDFHQSVSPCCFTTASGKRVMVSHDTLVKIKAAFADADQDAAQAVDSVADNIGSLKSQAGIIPYILETVTGKTVQQRSLVSSTSPTVEFDSISHSSSVDEVQGNLPRYQVQRTLNDDSSLASGVDASKQQTSASCNRLVTVTGRHHCDLDGTAVKEPIVDVHMSSLSEQPADQLQKHGRFGIGPLKAAIKRAHPAASVINNTGVNDRVAPPSSATDVYGCRTAELCLTTTPAHNKQHASASCQAADRGHNSAGSGPSTPLPIRLDISTGRGPTRHSGDRAVPRFSFGNKAFTPHTPRMKSKQIFPKILPFRTLQMCQRTTECSNAATSRDVSIAVTRRPFLEAVDGARPHGFSSAQLRNLGVSDAIMAVNFRNAEEFTFGCHSHSSNELACVKIPQLDTQVVLNQGCAGKEEIFRSFIGMPGIEPKLVSKVWVNNHYRWIIWKLACYERSFPLQFAGSCLTMLEVLRQLRHRYEREINKCQRSCLKKILERDDDAKKRMVLVVTSAWHSSNNTGIHVGDGWYHVTADLDKPLELMVKRKLIKEGTKLCICNADLTGSADGHDPLEAKDAVKLRIYANSTRRARWDVKLGFQRNAQPFAVPLNSLYSDGGTAGCIHAVIARVYPMQYMEKPESGFATFRNAAAEDRAARKFQDEQKELVDKMYQSVSKEIQSEHAYVPLSKKRPRLSKCDLSCLTTGAEIYEAFETSEDPETLQQSLTEVQMGKLLDYQRLLSTKQEATIHEKMHEALQKHTSQALQSRNVTPLRKVRIVGSHGLDIDSQSYTMLTIWRPTADVDEILHEGTFVKLFSVTVSEARGRTSSVRVQLSTKRGSLILPAITSESLSQILYEPREVLSVSDICKMTSKPKYDEVDVIGTVISLQSPAVSLQTVFIADKDFSFAIVKFWGGLEAFGCDQTVVVGQSLLISSISWGVDERLRIPSLTVTELTTIRQQAAPSAKTVHGCFLEEALLKLDDLQAANPKHPKRNYSDTMVSQSVGGHAAISSMPPSSLSRPCQRSSAMQRQRHSDNSFGKSTSAGTKHMHASAGEAARMTADVAEQEESVWHGSIGTELTSNETANSSQLSCLGDDVILSKEYDVKASAARSKNDSAVDGEPFSQMADNVLSQVDQLEQSSLVQHSVGNLE